MKFKIQEKWIDAEQSSFKETNDPTSGKIKYYLEALIVPFGKISRNGIQYKKEGIENTHTMLVGKPLMHNHVLEGAETLPRGEWVTTWLGVEGMYARAEVYNTTYNSSYIEFLKSASSPRVSLQVTGDAAQKKNKEGKYYQEAEINDWLEASTVNVPGFDDAKASFAVAMSEAFKGSKTEDNTMDNSDDLTSTKLPKNKELALGKHKTKGGEEITVHSITGNKAVISGNDSKNKEIDLDALKAILGKEGYGDNTKFVRYKDYDIELIPHARGVDAFIRRKGDKKSNLDDTSGKDEKTALKNAKSMIDIGVEGFFKKLSDIRESVIEERITKLEFDDSETTRDAVKILKDNDIKHLAQTKKSVILFNNDIDKKTAKMLLIRKGMKGLSKQSFFDKLSDIRESFGTIDSKKRQIKIGNKVKTKSGRVGKVIGMGRGVVNVMFNDGEKLFLVSTFLTLI